MVKFVLKAISPPALRRMRRRVFLRQTPTQRSSVFCSARQPKVIAHFLSCCYLANFSLNQQPAAPGPHSA